MVSDGPRGLAGSKLIADFEGWLKIAGSVADDFELRGIHDRTDAIKKRISKQKLTNFDISTEARVLLETLQAGLKGQLVYRYPDEKSRVFYKWTEDWSAALKSFQSAKKDIQAAIDLWALGHSTASVFQFMRVLECGLRALAHNVGRTFETQQWQNIIDEINSSIEAERKTLPRGKERNERLQFLSEAAKEFVYFKDGWRNYVSHGRGDYDEHQARSVMEHVRSFMNHLATQLNDASAE